MKFSTVLKELRKKYNMTQDELAKKLNVAKSTVSMYERGERMPSFEIIEILSDIFNVSIDTLYGREGDSTPLPQNVRPVVLKKFPMLGEIACGEPKYADQDFETFFEASAEIRADFCLTAKGDSMIGARIHNGDVVFIKEQPIVDNGQIAAVIIDNEATLKRWYYYPDKQKLVLNPENPAYEPLVYIGEELNTIRCLGLAVCFMSKI